MPSLFMSALFEKLKLIVDQSKISIEDKKELVDFFSCAKEEEQKIFRRLAEDYPWNFYGVMARKRMESSWELVPDAAGPSNQEDEAWQPEPVHAAP